MAKKAAKKPVRKPRAGAKPARTTAKPTKATRKLKAVKAEKKPGKPLAPIQPEPVLEPAPSDQPKEPIRAEPVWVVWQDGSGVWLGTLDEFKLAKRPETVVCDVVNTGDRRDFNARQRALHFARLLRKLYADSMKPWLYYDDAAQAHRMQEWERRSQRSE